MSTPKTLKTLKGETVHREEKLWVEGLGKEVVCAPYDDHWVYYTSAPGQSSLMCSCGSVAVVMGAEGGGLMIVCLLHATTGFHTTGGREWI